MKIRAFLSLIAIILFMCGCEVSVSQGQKYLASNGKTINAQVYGSYFIYIQDETIKLCQLNDSTGNNNHYEVEMSSDTILFTRIDPILIFEDDNDKKIINEWCEDIHSIKPLFSDYKMYILMDKKFNIYFVRIYDGKIYKDTRMLIPTVFKVDENADQIIYSKITPTDDSNVVKFTPIPNMVPEKTEAPSFNASFDEFFVEQMSK